MIANSLEEKRNGAQPRSGAISGDIGLRPFSAVLKNRPDLHIGITVSRSVASTRFRARRVRPSRVRVHGLIVSPRYDRDHQLDLRTINS